jgi:endonuclease/exonuclease/phosphatase family metal-dependent hydrolase
MELLPPPVSEVKNRRRIITPRRAAAVGLICLAGAAGYGGKSLINESGQSTLYMPAQVQEQVIDNHMGVVDWNMHNEVLSHTGQLRKLMARNKADVVTLQEVNANDAQKLARKFPRWYTSFVIGERLLQQPNSGGYGNVIMTRQKPTNIKTQSITSDSLFSKAKHMTFGLFDDVAHANTSAPKMKEGMQERRAIIAETIQVRDADKLRDVQIITTHIAGIDRIGNPQMDKVEKFVKKVSKEGLPTIFCADLNDIPEEVIPRFTKLGFIVPQTNTPTTVETGITVDYCMYREEGVLGLGSVNVSPPGIETDHRALSAEWDAKPGIIPYPALR